MQERFDYLNKYINSKPSMLENKDNYFIYSLINAYRNYHSTLINLQNTKYCQTCLNHCCYGDCCGSEEFNYTTEEKNKKTIKMFNDNDLLKTILAFIKDIDKVIEQIKKLVEKNNQDHKIVNENQCLCCESAVCIANCCDSNEHMSLIMNELRTEVTKAF